MEAERECGGVLWRPLYSTERDKSYCEGMERGGRSWAWRLQPAVVGMARERESKRGCVREGSRRLGLIGGPGLLVRE